MKFLAIVAGALCWPICAHAVNVYACKGKNGETVYTNVQCPDAATTKTIGSYQPVPDDPRSQRQAAAYAASEHERLTASTATVEPYAGVESYDPPATSSSSTGYTNSLSEHFRTKRDKLANPSNARTASGTYANDLWNGIEHKGLPIRSTHSQQFEVPQPRGGVDQYGTFYAPAGPNGVVNTQNGQFMPKVSPNGYLNPTTGQITEAH